MSEEIADEQVVSEEKVEAITGHWSAMQNIENPFDLNDALGRQKEKVSEVFALKNRSIQLLQDEIGRLHKIFYEYSDRQVSFGESTNPNLNGSFLVNPFRVSRA